MPPLTQLVTCEDTAYVEDGFWNKYNMEYESFCNTYTIEEIDITSTFDSHIIPADYNMHQVLKETKTIKRLFLSMALAANRYTNYPIAEMFLEKGYNIITYDQRSSNENTAQYTTFGYWEKYDLIDYINYVSEQALKQEIGIWGTSFGGATAGLAMENKEIENKIDFLILDCPISEMNG